MTGEQLYNLTVGLQELTEKFKIGEETANNLKRTFKEMCIRDSEITEREYFGDLLRNTSRYQTSDKLNDDFNISNEISIVACLLYTS